MQPANNTHISDDSIAHSLNASKGTTTSEPVNPPTLVSFHQQFAAEEQRNTTQLSLHDDSNNKHNTSTLEPTHMSMPMILPHNNAKHVTICMDAMNTSLVHTTLLANPGEPNGQTPMQEVSGNVEEPVFLGDIVLSYILRFLAWVMRNPKAFSCILVSIMLALFTKYAQDIVVDVVELVVRAHPAVTPTAELRSITSILANEIRSMVKVAQTTGAAYLGRNVVGGSLDSMVSTEFLNVPYALQTSFGGNALYFTYVSYRMNVTLTNGTSTYNTTRWGDMGCQYDTKLHVSDYTTSTVVDDMDSAGAYCTYTDTSGTMYAFVGTNLSASLMTPLPDMYDDEEDYTQVISEMTVADQAAGGIWHVPTTYYDPLLNRTLALLTYSYPLAFDASGKWHLNIQHDPLGGYGMSVRHEALRQRLHHEHCGGRYGFWCVLHVHRHERHNVCICGHEPFRQPHDATAGHVRRRGGLHAGDCTDDGGRPSCGRYLACSHDVLRSAAQPYASAAHVLLPISVDASGKCIAAVSVDVDRDWFSTRLRSKTFANRELVMVGLGRSPASSQSTTGGLRFVLENLEGSLLSSTAADRTALPRVNNLVDTMIANAGSASVMQNTSFVLNGLIYQSLTVMDNWVILGVGPTSDSTTEIGDAMMSLIVSFERSGTALKASQSLAVETCVQSVSSNRSSRFVRELSNLLKSFGPQVHGAYLAYPSGVNNSDNGICGCEQNSSSFDTSIDIVLNGDALPQKCFTVLPNQTMMTFDNARIPPSTPSNGYTASNFENTIRNNFVRDVVSNITSADVSATSNYGIWTAPYAYAPSGSELMSFVLPLAFETNVTSGVERCTQAIVVEISLSVVPKLLTTFTNNGSTEVYWLDMEALQYMGSSSSYYKNVSYSWASTPNATINNIMKQVSTAASSDAELVNRLDALTLNGAAHAGGAVDQVINYARVFRPGLGVSIEQRTRWGLVEMLSATEALNEFYPVPTVTSSSQALALLPMDVNLRLFAVVLVLMFVFTLNMFVLGCSTMGERPATISASGMFRGGSVTPNTCAPLLSGQTPVSKSGQTPVSAKSV
ncbi:transmembrane protein, putative [Bodo saltans]|uniref:Transmembrane protein, putative n=1 Tax=Bodo saltans TaxID=75058 RepID=A0A0S4JQX7_BODSA|nr:transmembrane protein, putative [Bodo saltans]|eukprot:CUG91467.1 transmembrane protein, putative [Bodo saltans]